MMPDDALNTNTELSDEQKLHRRRWRRREFIYQLVLFAISLVIIVLSFTMRSAGQHFVFMPGSVLPMPPSCLSRAFFGIDCPGCGLTRSFISISHGEFLRAWGFNPASFVVYLFVAGQLPWRLFQIARIFTNRYPLFSPWLFAPLFVCCGCLILQWLLKLSGVWNA